ncbi:uncharacterized protein LOC127839466 [Dreissena polymorpha]|uniref:Uncharacterized protein n=1 Tax=Dreissena polymorpha TaxID=45954 RepID=A0A9D4J0R1_DREPO|nr:uncharacterized protein LOC127839466 [Dreissena polymorpha]KAH3791377.1 hypothetical protein DPMN_144861 [Dreissena polymorpha]
MGWAANVLGLLLLVSPYPGKCGPIGQLNLEVEVTNDNIEMSWTVNTTVQNIYGFKTILYNDHDQTLYTSSVIQSQERKMTISNELKGTGTICIQQLLNHTEVLQEACKKVKVSDLKMVIGIMAGAIFLFPCLMTLAYIIYKDKNIAKIDYAQFESHIEQRVITERPSDSNKTVLQDTKSFTRNVDVANRGETRQENGANKKTRKESDTLEITDTKEPNELNRKVILFSDKAIQSGQEENVQWLSKTDSNRSRGTKRPSSSKTNVTNDQNILQKKTEIYVVKL